VWGSVVGEEHDPCENIWEVRGGGDGGVQAEVMLAGMGLAELADVLEVWACVKGGEDDVGDSICVGSSGVAESERGIEKMLTSHG
jgi:hypothetical protein